MCSPAISFSGPDVPALFMHMLAQSISLSLCISESCLGVQLQAYIQSVCTLHGKTLFNLSACGTDLCQAWSVSISHTKS